MPCLLADFPDDADCERFFAMLLLLMNVELWLFLLGDFGAGLARLGEPDGDRLFAAFDSARFSAGSAPRLPTLELMHFLLDRLRGFGTVFA
jgi:hypothetical protein